MANNDHRQLNASTLDHARAKLQPWDAPQFDRAVLAVLCVSVPPEMIANAVGTALKAIDAFNCRRMSERGAALRRAFPKGEL